VELHAAVLRLVEEIRILHICSTSISGCEWVVTLSLCVPSRCFLGRLRSAVKVRPLAQLAERVRGLVQPEPGRTGRPRRGIHRGAGTPSPDAPIGCPAAHKGSTVSYGDQSKISPADFAPILELVTSGEFVTETAKQLAVDEMPAAHGFSEGGRLRGKIVVWMPDPA
jgi:hypothetical protein